jgi:hypothetical protein
MNAVRHLCVNTTRLGGRDVNEKEVSFPYGCRRDSQSRKSFQRIWHYHKAAGQIHRSAPLTAAVEQTHSWRSALDDRRLVEAKIVLRASVVG